MFFSYQYYRNHSTWFPNFSKNGSKIVQKIKFFEAVISEGQVM